MVSNKGGGNIWGYQAIKNIDEVCEMLGVTQEVKEENGDVYEEWELKYTRKHFNLINKRITAYSEAKKIFAC